jgi:hypothetical protein
VIGATDRPTELIPPGPRMLPARHAAHACTGAEPGQTNLRGGKARR